MAVDADFLESLTWNEKISTLVSYLLVAGMMACMLSIFSLLGQVINPGWRGWYFAPLAYVISLESLYVYQRRSRLVFPEAGWFSFFAAEWGTILIALRCLIYLKQGVGQIWIDLSRGPAGFLEGFFYWEFTIALVGAILVWFITNWFADLLQPLRNDATLVLLAGGADTSIERHAVRRQLANLVLMIGVLMALLTAGMRSETFTSWARIPLMRIGVLNVMIYFVFGLLLLSQTQFALLRARWGLNRVKIGSKIAASWIIYTLVFLVLVGLASLLLPTSYTFGLLTLMNYLLGLVFLAGGLILWLISIPIYFVSVLLASLFGTEPLERMPPPEAITPPPLEETGASSIPFWLEMARSLFFWVVLATLLVLALLYFFRSRRDDFARLGKIPLFRWLKDWLLLVKQTVSSARQSINQISQQGLALLRRSRARKSDGEPWGFLSLRQLNTRSRVRFYYLAMLRRAGETGHARRPSQSPLEFARSMERIIREGEKAISPSSAEPEAAAGSMPEPPPGAAIWQLTDEFMQARYSPEEISEIQAGMARRAWDRLRRVMQGWKKIEEKSKGG